MRGRQVIYRYLALTALALAFAGGSAFADMPKVYKKCKICHGIPGKANGKVGPDLVTSDWPIEQWVAQAKFGSKRDNRPPKRAKYKNKKMTKQKVTPEQVKMIYDWVHTTR